jgi:hypothetical protein
MADSVAKRWELFEEKERAFLALAIASAVFMRVAQSVEENDGLEGARNDAALLDTLVTGTELLSQMQESFGQQGIDTDILERLAALREELGRGEA